MLVFDEISEGLPVCRSTCACNSDLVPDGIDVQVTGDKLKF